MKKIVDTLNMAGFSLNEIKIYLMLLNFGRSKIGEIVRELGLHKSSCYNSINSLIRKGIVSLVKIGEVSHFYAENPETIIDYIEEKKKNINEILPELKKSYSRVKDESVVKHFKGEKGIKSVLFDILREGENNDVFGSEGQLSDKMPIFVKQYIRMQNEKNIKTRNLIGEGRKRKYSKGTLYKYIDKEFESNVVTNIYGDKIAILIWSDNPEAIIIENKVAADSYRSYFEFMWKHAKNP